MGKIDKARFFDHITHQRPSDGGLDGMSPTDLSLISPNASNMLVDMLDIIEEGGEWPFQMQHAKAAFLAKDPLHLDDCLKC